MIQVDNETELTDQQKMSAGLRELADFYDEHPDFISCSEHTFYKYTSGREVFIELAKSLGPFEKGNDGDNYTLFRMFGPIKLQLYCSRDLVCTKRMVTKTVEVEEWKCPGHLLSSTEKGGTSNATARVP